MKKSVFFLTLLLCLSLIFPGAHAEDTYVPGERMRSLVSSALEAGQLVGGEAHFSLTLPDSMLPDDEEGRAQFDALAEVIQGVSLAGGMGRLDDGYRVELGGAYTAPSGDNVYVTGAANLTADGLSLESNLIEGERLSIRWETLLEMLGLSENEIDALLSLPTTDWDSALNELNDELAQAAETFGKLADPYLVTLADFAATLNIQRRGSRKRLSGRGKRNFHHLHRRGAEPPAPFAGRSGRKRYGAAPLSGTAHPKLRPDRHRRRQRNHTCHERFRVLR